MDGFSTASLITRSTNDITQVQNFLSMGLRMMCFAPIMGLGGLIMGLSKCVSLAWVLALALIIMLGLILILFVALTWHDIVNIPNLIKAIGGTP